MYRKPFTLSVIFLIISVLSLTSATAPGSGLLTPNEEKKMEKLEKKLEKRMQKLADKGEDRPNTLPLISLGLGLLAILSFFFSGVLGIIMGVGALITGLVVLLNRNAYDKKGRNMALAGILLGGVFLVLGLLVLLLVLDIFGIESLEGLYEHVLG